MDEIQPQAADFVKLLAPRPRRRKNGGRIKGSKNRRTKLAIEICQELNFHPAAFLATIALTGLMPNPDGTTTAVDSDQRLRAAQSLAPFVMPRLASTQVTGKDEGPIETATLDMTAILQNPDLVAQIQNAVIASVEADRPADTPRAFLYPGANSV